MATTYQIISAMNGAPAVNAAIESEDKAIEVAKALSRALGLPFNVIKLEVVHTTTAILGGGGIVVPEGTRQ